MLLDGVNHVAILTNDADRLHAFYLEVFDASVSHRTEGEGFRLSMVDVGPNTELNVFEVAGNTEAERQTPMFGRGRIDHIGLQAASVAAFDTIRGRLVARAQRATASPIAVWSVTGLVVVARDPDGLEAEASV